MDLFRINLNFRYLNKVEKSDSIYIKKLQLRNIIFMPTY